MKKGLSAGQIKAAGESDDYTPGYTPGHVSSSILQSVLSAEFRHIEHSLDMDTTTYDRPAWRENVRRRTGLNRFI